MLGQGGCGTALAVRDQFGDNFVIKRATDATPQTGIGSLWHEKVGLARLNLYVPEVHCFRPGENGKSEIVMGRAPGNALADFMPQVRDEIIKGKHFDLLHNYYTNSLIIIAKILRAIEYFESKGLVHRDLKPDNIIVEFQEGGRLKVTIIDLGVWCEADEPLKEVAGSPRYMAPEQAELNRGIDSRSDVYAVGIMLYESLFGRTQVSRDLEKVKGKASLRDLSWQIVMARMNGNAFGDLPTDEDLRDRLMEHNAMQSRRASRIVSVLRKMTNETPRNRLRPKDARIELEKIIEEMQAPDLSAYATLISVVPG